MDSIYLLSRRGFLINNNEHGFFLSDNSDSHDREYLEEILSSYEIGFIDQDGYIIIKNDSSVLTALLDLFAPVKQGTVGVGSCICTRSWSYHVRRRFHTPKIPVKWLEANVALYIKALSACGIYTGGCCDGNHPNRDFLYIEFEPPYHHIHKAMWEYHLKYVFNLEWDNSYSSINLKENRQNQYDELFHAAQYIYAHRWNFIDIRLEASKWITKKALKQLGEEDVRQKFLKEFAKSLKKNFGDVCTIR